MDYDVIEIAYRHHEKIDGSGYPNKLNGEYLTICFYNLYEKYICGGVKEEDWEKFCTGYWIFNDQP